MEKLLFQDIEIFFPASQDLLKCLLYCGENFSKLIILQVQSWSLVHGFICANEKASGKVFLKFCIIIPIFSKFCIIIPIFSKFGQNVQNLTPNKFTQ